MSYNAHGIRLEFVIYFVHRAERTRGAERGGIREFKKCEIPRQGTSRWRGSGWFEGDGEGRGEGRTKINGKRTGCYRCYPSLLFLPGTFSSLTVFSASRSLLVSSAVRLSSGPSTRRLRVLFPPSYALPPPRALVDPHSCENFRSSESCGSGCRTRCRR